MMSNEPKETEPTRERNFSLRYAGSWCLTCTATFFLFSVLFLTIIFFTLEIPHGLGSVTWRTLTVAVLHSVFLPFIVYVAEILKTLFPWPILVILALVVILRVWGPDRIQDWLSSAKLEIPGFLKYEGTKVTEAFRKELGEAQRAVERANKELRDAYESATVYVTQLRDKHGIAIAAAELAKKVAETIGPNCPEDYRFTVHVLDFVFDDRLYQITEYYDKGGREKTAGKAHRTLSTRYGIVGRVWRSGVAEVEGELIAPEDRALLPKIPTEADIERFIARRWGLTLVEAALIRSYESYGAIRVECGGEPLGVVYFDSQKRNAFGDVTKLKALQTDLQQIVRQSPLTMKLLELGREVEPRSRIRIYPR